MVSTATACVCLHYLIKQHGVAEVVRIIKSSMSQEYCVTCWECFPPQASPKSATFHSPGKYISNNPGFITLILNSCKLYVLIFILLFHGFGSYSSLPRAATQLQTIGVFRQEGHLGQPPTASSRSNQTLSRALMSEGTYSSKWLSHWGTQQAPHFSANSTLVIDRFSPLPENNFRVV